MTDTVTIYLPLNTYVTVRGFTDAAYQQQVTIVQENGTKTVMTGSGEHETPMSNSPFAIQTPSSSSNPSGYQVTVTVQSNQGGTWVPSSVTEGHTAVMYYNLIVVVSEDSTDADWNDAVVQFSWWVQDR